MAQTAHTGSFGPLLSSWAGLEGSLTRVEEVFLYWRLAGAGVGEEVMARL